MARNRILLAVILMAFSFAQMGGCGKAKNGGSSTATSSGGGTPVSFFLTSPTEGASVGVRPVFTWTAASGASSYSLQVSTASDFSSISIQQSPIVPTTYQLGVDLLTNTTYYWRVYASVNSALILAEGSPRSFTTPNDLPGSFQLTAPANGEIGTSLTPTLSWSPSTGATSYSIEGSMVDTFTSIAFQASGLTSTSYTPSTLAQVTTYHWRVTAHNAAGPKSASNNAFSFVTSSGVNPPGDFSQSLPSAGSVIASPFTPTYTWGVSANASSYTLQVSKDNFSTFEQFSTTSTSFTQPTSLVAGQAYKWRVEAVGAGGRRYAANAPLSFSTQTAAPSLFTLISPIENAVNVSSNPTFSWNASTGAATYTLQVSTNSGFTGALTINQSNISATSILSPATLAGTYYWRVIAVNTGGSTQSAVRSFTTALGGGPVPGAFALISPVNNATNVALNPAYTWGASANVSTYRLQVDLDINFTAPLEYEKFNLAVTTYQPQTFMLANGTTYFWRVIAENANGNTQANNGTAWTFTTAAAGVNPPGTFDLISPANAISPVLASLTPTLSWGTSSSATSYRVRISERADLLTFSEAVVTGTSHTVSPALEYSKTYYWWVIASNTAGEKRSTSTYTFRTADGPLGTFNPVYPVSTANDPQQNVPYLPTFEWTASTNAAYYQIKCGTNTNFIAGTVVIDADNVVDQDLNKPGIQYRSTIPLLSGQWHYWNVWAVNVTEAGIQRKPGAYQAGFKVQSAPSNFAAIAPASGATAVAFRPEFSWGVSYGAQKYHLQVSRSTNFSEQFNPDLVLNEKDLTGTIRTCPITLQTNTTHYWRVTAINATTSVIMDNAPRAFTVLNQKPAAFALISPAKDATAVDSTNPTFTWNPSEGAMTYTLQVSTTTSFVEFFGQALPVNVSGITTPSFTTNVTLGNGAAYYWRVLAINAAGQTISTDNYWGFRTSAVLPSSPTLVSPLDLARVTGKPTFTWNAAPNASHYTLQVTTNFALPNTVFETDLTVLTRTPDVAYTVGATYYWRVIAVNGIGQMPSVTRSFVYGNAPVAPTLTSPIDLAVGISTTQQIFTWAAATDVVSYALEVSPSENFTGTMFATRNISGTQTTQVTAYLLQVNTPYFWRLVATNDFGTTRSVVRKFTTIAPPGTFTLVGPQNGGVTTTPRPTFTWTASTSATHYSLKVATDLSLTNLVIDQGSLQTTSYTATVNLVAGQPYYWQVVARNAVNVISSAVWSFSVPLPPGAFSLVSPAHGATNVSLTPTLSWSSSTGATSYRLVVTLVDTAVIDQNVGNVTSYVSTALAPNATFTWRVWALNGGGATGSNVQTFTTQGTATAPGAFNLLSPTNSSNTVSRNGPFSWQPSFGATDYEIDIATGADFVNIVQRGTSKVAYFESPTLASNTRYYWRVTAVNANGRTPHTGAAWMFITTTQLLQ